MKSLAALLIVFTATGAFAQDAPKYEAFGGYQYVSLDTRGGGRTRQAFNGWEIDGSYQPWRHLALVADVGCGYKNLPTYFNGTPVTANAHVYPVLFGPRFLITSRRVTVFAEGLVGFAYESVSVSGLGNVGENRFAMGGGGGFDVKLARHFTLRLAKADYILVRSGLNLNNLRISTGLVLKF